MKRVTLIIVSLLLIVSVCSPALAAGNHIRDNAGLLYQADIEQLNTKADQIARQYSFTIRILTVDSFGGKDAQAYADDYYDQYMLALNGGNGILFAVAINDRKWAVTTNGDTVSVITNSDIDGIMEDVQPQLSDGNYYKAFDLFLDGIEEEYISEENAPLVGFLIALAIGAAAGGITLLIMRSGMKTAKQQHGAGNYMVESSYDLFQCRDIFLYSRTTKVRKPENNGSGGGSRSRSGGGGSRGGRSGRF